MCENTERAGKISKKGKTMDMQTTHYTKKMDPNLLLWNLVCPGRKPPPKSLSIGAVISQYAKEPLLSTQKWRKVKLRRLELRFQQAKALKIPISTLTLGKINALVSSVNPSNTYNFRSTLNSVYRFVRDGHATASFEKSKVLPSANGHVADPNSIQIKQAQVITEEEALALISMSRGKHSEFREQFLARLTSLQPGQAYAFVPDNLSEDPIQRKRELNILKNNVSNTIARSKLPFNRKYIPHKNLFVIVHKKENSNKKGD